MIYYAGKMGSKLVKTDVVKKDTKLNSNTLLRLVSFLLHQSLPSCIFPQDFMRNFLKKRISHKSTCLKLKCNFT